MTGCCSTTLGRGLHMSSSARRVSLDASAARIVVRRRSRGCVTRAVMPIAADAASARATFVAGAGNRVGTVANRRVAGGASLPAEAAALVEWYGGSGTPRAS